MIGFDGVGGVVIGDGLTSSVGELWEQGNGELEAWVDIVGVEFRTKKYEELV